MRLLVSVVLCLPFSVFGQEFENEYAEIEGSEYKRKGCKFVMAEKSEGFDTATVEDPITGDVIIKRHPSSPVPALMNGKKIYKLKEVTTPPQTIIGTRALEEYILDNIKATLGEFMIDSFTIKLELNNIIVDEKGRIAYYTFGAVKGWASDQMTRTLNNGGLDKKIESLMSSVPLMKPASYNGKAVTAYTGITLDYYEIDIRKPIVTYRKTENKYHGLPRYGMTK